MRITLGKQDDRCTICWNHLVALDFEHHEDVDGPALVIRCETCEFDWAVVRLVEDRGYAVAMGYSRPLAEVIEPPLNRQERREDRRRARGWRKPPGAPGGP